MTLADQFKKQIRKTVDPLSSAADRLFASVSVIQEIMRKTSPELITQLYISQTDEQIVAIIHDHDDIAEEDETPDIVLIFKTRDKLPATAKALKETHAPIFRLNKEATDSEEETYIGYSDIEEALGPVFVGIRKSMDLHNEKIPGSAFNFD